MGNQNYKWNQEESKICELLKTFQDGLSAEEIREYFGYPKAMKNSSLYKTLGKLVQRGLLSHHLGYRPGSKKQIRVYRVNGVHNGGTTVHPPVISLPSVPFHSEVSKPKEKEPSVILTPNGQESFKAYRRKSQEKSITISHGSKSPLLITWSCPDLVVEVDKTGRIAIR